jgi:hypothetical protein
MRLAQKIHEPQEELAERRGQLLHQGHRQNAGTSLSAGARTAFSLLCVVITLAGSVNLTHPHLPAHVF